MTMIERFPDDSARIREKKRTGRKAIKIPFLKADYRTQTDQALAAYYADEFRTWHLQLGLFITMSVVVIYFCVFTALDYFR